MCGATVWRLEEREFQYSMSDEEDDMDGFTMMTWVAGLLFVILGLGSPKRGWFGPSESPEGDGNISHSGDDEYHG
jgi:hypothetical protein